MKKKLTLLPVIAILIYVLLTSYAAGPGLSGYERTGAGTTTGCASGTSCHAATATASTTVSVQLIEVSTGSVVATYVGGRSYTVKITGTQTSGSLTLPRFGFQLTAVKTASHTTTAGNLTAPAGTHTVIPSGSTIKIVEQSSALTGTYVTGTGTAGTTYNISVPWTAPVAGTGGVSFFSVLNAVNANGAADAGDKWNNTSLAVTELAAISGTSAVCVGGSITLTDASGGGTWSGGSGFATVGSSGIITGSSAGIATISYTLGGSSVTKTVTVNAAPSAPAAISGTLTVCAGGATTSLSDVTGGGTWSSVSPGIATVSSTGTVTGVSGGTTTISYTLTNSCGSVAATEVITVDPLPTAPGAITGTATVCEGGATTLLTDVTAGGTWSSTLPGVATVGSTGVVTSGAAGTATISYTETNSCGSLAVTKVVTVNPLPGSPAPISGTGIVCEGGATTSLSDATGGGTWSSSAPGNASVGSTGILTGISAGTATISYTETNSCGSIAAIKVVTISPLPVTPSAISGTTTVCAGGATITLSDPGGPGGGTWSSTLTGIAAVSSAGIVTGVSGGTSTISYTITNSCGSATATTEVTVNPLPSAPGAISGSTSVCAGGPTLSLSDATVGGIWSSTAPGNAIVGSTGIVTGLSNGTTTISYTVTNGCGSIAATQVITINSAPSTPAAISGTATVCVGNATSLSDATAGGAWSSLPAGVATVGTGGSVTGVSSGTATISYTETNGCGSAAATVVVTVNDVPTAPAAISGAAAVCEAGGTISLSDATAGGVWSSTATGTATVGSTGAVTGVIAGTTTISYTETNGCGGAAATIIVTVNPLPPTPAAITGTAILCAGTTTSLSDATGGGTWTSLSPGVATVSSTGTVTGASGGTATVSYTLSNSCSSVAATIVVTINPLSSAGVITGPSTVCTGSNISLTDAVTGGTWIATNINGSISGAGVYTGNTGGTDTVLYSVTNSCSTDTASKIITITSTAVADPITGPATVCLSGTSSLTDDVIGGTWSSSNTGVATIGSASGMVSGVTAGTATITYSVFTGCGSATAMLTITVNSLPAVPAAISGTAVVCAGGATTSLSDATAGGAWSSVSTVTATVGSTGIVSGVAAGTTTISYTEANSCGSTAAAVVITVNPLPTTPAPITGPATVCESGGVTILSDITGGGSWSSVSTGTATAGSATGIVTGVSAGTAAISYTITNGCGSIAATTIVTVNSVPTAALGTASVCAGATTALSDVTSGGTWSSVSPGIATVSSTGNVSGVLAGTSSIAYTLPTGCATAIVVTVNVQPGAILGAASLCPSTTTILSDSPSSGIWSSSNTAIATIGSVTGIISGISAGTTLISCTLPDGCFSTLTETVNPLPAAISGTASVCEGAVTSLTDADAGGTWTSGSGGTAVAGSAGDITGVLAGTATVSYTLATGCATSIVMTVNPQPAAVSGATSVCTGTTISLSDIPTGGNWTSGSIGVATIGSSSGIVSGIAAGTSVITYTLPAGCFSTLTETVNASPAAITGALVVCAASVTTLSDITAGGTWSSGSTGTATAGSAGDVSGISAGTANITYALPTGCATTAIVTVNPLPGGIIGDSSLCVGTTTVLSAVPAVGEWSSGDPGIATIGSATGIVSGVSAGTVVISCSLPTGCATTLVETVNPSPAAISGPALVCAGSTTILSDLTTGGIWSSGTTATATVGSTGIVSGLIAGTARITYALLTGCTLDVIVTVNPLPGAIFGDDNVCVGSTIVLAVTPASGSWSSSDTAITNIGALTGIVSGISSGTAVISCTLPTGCFTTLMETVNPLPADISGTPHVCVGITTQLSDADAGGTWSSSNTATATVGVTTGLVSGVAEGSATITYTLPTGCYTTVVVHDTCNLGVTEAIAGNNNISIFPNPNNGAFYIKGSFGPVGREYVFAEVREVTGRVVYSEKLSAQNGSLNNEILLDNTLANGLYLLTLHAGEHRMEFRFAILK